MKSDTLLAEQIAYYRARAPEYDEWFERRGRYDRGPEHTAQWNREVESLRDAVRDARLDGGILEIACGTGWWTAELARAASHVLAVDASPEALELNRRRVQATNVRYRHVDVFEYPSLGAFDAVFFSFWLTHVPPDRFERFWRWVARCTKPAGRVFFIDNRWYPEYRWPEEGAARPDDAPSRHIAERRLTDGRRFKIVKVFYEPEDLAARLARLGWSGEVSATPQFFIWGDVRKASV